MLTAGSHSMNNISVSKRVLLVAVLPLAALLFISLQSTLEGLHRYNEKKFMLQISSVVNELAAVTHSMQVERGTSAGFTGSSATELPQNVIKARQSTDDEIAKLKELTKNINGVGHEEILFHLEQLIARFDTIPGFRKVVEEKTRSVGDVLGFYSSIISDLPCHLVEVLSLVRGRSSYASRRGSDVCGFLFRIFRPDRRADRAAFPTLHSGVRCLGGRGLNDLRPDLAGGFPGKRPAS